MWSAFGLLVSVAVCAWIALDALLSSSARRPRGLAVGLLGACGGAWAAGELLCQLAGTPAEYAFGRRVLFLGACFIGGVWFWLALQAAHARTWLDRPGLLAPLLVVPLVCYSSLYWGEARWWGDYSVAPPVRKPLFTVQVTWNYALVCAGLAVYAGAALRLRDAGRRRALMLAAVSLVPLAANAAYLGGLLGGYDPTAILLAGSGLWLRFGLVDPGLVSFVPLDRRDVLEQLEAGVLMADLDGNVVGANAAARSLLGVARVEGEPLEAMLELAAAQSERALDVRRFPLRWSGAEIGTGAVLSDRTEAEQASRRLQLAGRLEAVGFLTAGIAHEVNNPLAYIRTNLGLLAKHIDALGGDPEAQEVLAETQDGVDRIARLVQRLRRFARHDAAPEARRSLCLSELAERAAAMARVGQAPDCIHIRAAAATPPVHGDESQLVQVILNLLVNAIQASGPSPRIEVDVTPAAGGATLAVLDRGCGLPEEQFSNLFDPFFTTKPPGEGTGLGLSLSYELAKGHGGRLDAANRPGGGAVFTLWLPAADEGEAGSDAPEGERRRAQVPARVPDARA